MVFRNQIKNKTLWVQNGSGEEVELDTFPLGEGTLARAVRAGSASAHAQERACGRAQVWGARPWWWWLERFGRLRFGANTVLSRHRGGGSTWIWFVADFSPSVVQYVYYTYPESVFPKAWFSEIKLKTLKVSKWFWGGT